MQLPCRVIKSLFLHLAHSPVSVTIAKVCLYLAAAYTSLKLARLLITFMALGTGRTGMGWGDTLAASVRSLARITLDCEIDFPRPGDDDDDDGTRGVVQGHVTYALNLLCIIHTCYLNVTCWEEEKNYVAMYVRVRNGYPGVLNFNCLLAVKLSTAEKGSSACSVLVEFHFRQVAHCLTRTERRARVFLFLPSLPPSLIIAWLAKRVFTRIL